MATTVPIVVPAVAEAATVFLDTCIAPSTRRSYTQTTTRLITATGPRRSPRWTARRCGSCSPPAGTARR
jgi:hypothetical protein